MDEYVSREAVLSKCQQIWSNADETTEIGVAIINLVDELADFVENIPSADVQPVKHGRWEYYRNNGIINTYICTNCQGKVEMAIDVNPNEFKFCPSCNARMDDGSDKNVRNLTNEETAVYESWIESEAKDTGVNIMGGDAE